MDAVLIGFIVAGLIIVFGALVIGFWIGGKEGRKQARADWLITGTVPNEVGDDPTIDDLRYAINMASEGLRRRRYVDTVVEQTEVVPGTWWKHRLNGRGRLVKVTAVARAYSGHRVTFRPWNGENLAIDKEVPPETEVLSMFVRRAEKVSSPHGIRRQCDLQNAGMTANGPNTRQFHDLHSQVNQPAYNPSNKEQDT